MFNLLTHRIIIVSTDSPFKNITFHVSSFCCYLGMKRIEATFFSNSFGILLDLPEAVLSTTGGAAVGDGGGLEPGAV